MGRLRFAPAPLPADVVAAHSRAGHTPSATAPALLHRNRTELGRLVALAEGERTWTWAEVVDAASRVAGFLRASGVQPGDVVLWQLPNWWEAVIVGHGVLAAGAVSCPVVTIAREHELRAIVEAVDPRAVVTTTTFRSAEHTAMVDSVAEELGWSPVRVVVRGEATGWTPLDDVLRAAPLLADGIDPDDPALLVLTSGTTSGSKAVVHSTRSMLANGVRLSRHLGTTWDDTALVALPMAHVGGVANVFGQPLWVGSKVVVRERWDPEAAVDDALRHHVTLAGGMPVIAQELLDALGARGVERLPLRAFSCGGATFPAALAERMDAAALRPGRSYGMSECPHVSAPRPGDPAEVRLQTDGWVIEGCEVRVVGEDLAPLPAGTEGELLVRGPQQALGYVDPAHTADGYLDGAWFRSGDLGWLDEAGRLTVSGRLKDIINRGGEKISAREVEDLLVRQAGVLEAAVVPAPHERLGEQPAAFVRLRPGTPPEAVDGLADALLAAGLARHKVPRVWRPVDDFPRTAAGKVKKYLLRDELRDPGGAPR